MLATVFTYATAVGPGVAATPGDEFAGEVARVLDDPRGWRKYGYRFVHTTDRPDILIRLETAAGARRNCVFGGLSCWLSLRQQIIIHEDNWVGKSRSTLPVERYHNYVISHEMGHALGLPHRRCPADECRRRGMAECPASIMQQMTKGADHVAPCVQADWPLDADWLIDDPRLVRCGLPIPAFVALVLVLALLVGLMIAAGCTGGLGRR